MKTAFLLVALSLLTVQTQAVVELFSRAPNAPGIIESSWVYPDGYDADTFAYDDFTLPANGTVTEVRWRGGGATATLINFSITFFDSTAGGTQPLCGNPDISDAPYIYKKVTNSLCNPVAVGGGFYDYSYTLPVGQSFVGGHKYWLRIEGYTTSYPNWGIAKSTQGNGSYFRFITGLAMYQTVPGNTAFTLLGNFPATTVNGTVTLGDWAAPTTGVDLTVDLLDASNNVVDTQPCTLDISGGYSFTTSWIGSARLRMQSQHFLKKTVGPVALSGTTVNGVNAALVNGDVDGSGEVDAVDIDLVIAAFGSADTSADLDGSGEVDAVDIDIAITNFGAIDA